MSISVGTFNLNNLFSRYNFTGEIAAIKAGDTDIETSYDFTDPTSYKIRTFKGQLVKGKDPKEAARVAVLVGASNGGHSTTYFGTQYPNPALEAVAQNAAIEAESATTHGMVAKSDGGGTGFVGPARVARGSGVSSAPDPGSPSRPTRPVSSAKSDDGLGVVGLSTASI
jgi:hypothetical protein